MLPLSALGGGLFLGWSLGANNAANVFGAAVASRIITFRKATLICGAAVILGALCQGQSGIDTYGKLITAQSLDILLLVSIAVGITITLMTFFKLPISTSQAIVGAICGIGLSTGNMQWHLLSKVLLCWLATPVGSMLTACLVYKLLGAIIARVPMSMLTRDKILWSGLLVFGAYGSYALGANNVANATGIFSGQIPGLNDRHLALLGGVAIALGVITYGKPIMLAVGSGIMPLDAFTSLVAVSSMSVTMHVFAVVGVPVSSSQALVGAIVGIGFIRGVRSVHFGTLRNIVFGWFLTPVISLILVAAGYAIITGSA